jgi:hypothetical protein
MGPAIIDISVRELDMTVAAVDATIRIGLTLGVELSEKEAAALTKRLEDYGAVAEITDLGGGRAGRSQNIEAARAEFEWSEGKGGGQRTCSGTPPLPIQYYSLNATNTPICASMPLKVQHHVLSKLQRL